MMLKTLSVCYFRSIFAVPRFFLLIAALLGLLKPIRQVCHGIEEMSGNKCYNVVPQSLDFPTDPDDNL